MILFPTYDPDVSNIGVLAATIAANDKSPDAAWPEERAALVNRLTGLLHLDAFVPKRCPLNPTERAEAVGWLRSAANGKRLADGGDVPAGVKAYMKWAQEAAL